MALPDTVFLDEKKKVLSYIDQRKLPEVLEIASACDLRGVCDAIRSLAIRGAPAIGVGAAIGLYAVSCGFEEEKPEGFLYAVEKSAAVIANARPTAVNLSWAMNRMCNSIKNSRCKTVTALRKVLKTEALRIYNEDIASCRAIGEYGQTLFSDENRVITVCNAGALAAVRFGTALAPIYVGSEYGKHFSVYCCETRPVLQGARLTAYELCEAGIDTTLITDGMAASLMAKGGISAVLAGADRIAANGDTANKIGTYELAIAANYHNIPFYICAPRSTFDQNCCSGAEIVIEQRSADEVRLSPDGKLITHKDAKIYNPAFDVTPAKLITAFITDTGIIKSL